MNPPPDRPAGTLPRLGILGCGWIAANAYMAALEQAPLFTLACVHDSDPASARRLAAASGAAVAANIGELIGNVDAVVICTPPDDHPDSLRHALAAGRHVLCEKPVVRRAADLDDAWRPLLMGSATMRLRRDVAQLLDWTADGSIGPLRHVELSWLRGAGVPAPGSWRTDPATAPLGVLEDLGPHLLDLAAAFVPQEMQVVTGELACRYGAGGPQGAAWFSGGSTPAPYVVPDHCHACLAAAGVTVALECAWADGADGDIVRIVARGERGWAMFEGLFGFSTQRRTVEQVCRRSIAGGAIETVRFEPGPAEQIRAFARTLERFAEFQRGTAPACADVADVQKVARWMEAIAHHARQSGGGAP